MHYIFAVTVPFFAIVLLGWLAARAGVLPESAIPGLNTYVLYFALPCMLFRFGSSLPIARLADPALLGIYLFCALAVIGITVVATLGRVDLRNAAFGALVAAFPNAGFMGVPLLVALLGEAAAGPVIGAIVVDLVVTSTLCLALAQAHTQAQSAREGGRARSPWRGAAASLRGALTNPLPWAIAAGAAWGATPYALPGPLAQIVRMLGDSATPVALFTIGAVLYRAGRHVHTRTPLAQYLPVALIKLLLHPALVFGTGLGARALGVPVSPFGLMVLARPAPAAHNDRPDVIDEAPMHLTPEQHLQFERDGYLFFPGLFSADETRTLNDAVPGLYARREAYNVREKGKDAVRTNFAAHLYSEPFARLARHPRMIEPVQELLGEALYMHQFKINGKQAFDGDVWQWHQDYGTWLNDDKMPAERAMNIAIFLDDVNDYNGPLMFIPGSHQRGVVDARHDLTTTSYPLWTIDNELIAQLVDRAGGKNGGIVSPKGPAGSMILFHGCLVHASGSNLSPWNRVSVYLSLCAVSNHIRRFKRPEYIAHRDFTPITTLPDDCLLKSYPVELPWKNGMPASALETSTDEFRLAA